MDDSRPASELEILKQRGLSATPEIRRPAPPEADVAERRYSAAVEEFDRLLDQIRSYDEPSLDAPSALAVQQLIDGAVLAASDVRETANGLGEFPRVFVHLASGVAYFREIADASDLAYLRRVSELKKLRIRYHLAALSGPATPIVPLSAHESVLRDWRRHLLRQHVNIKPEELFARLRKKGRVSVFFDQDIAETAAVRLLEFHFDDISDWLTTKLPEEVFTFTDAEDVGLVFTRSEPRPRPTKHLRLVLIRDPSATSLRFPDGFRIKTGYPIFDDQLI